MVFAAVAVAGTLWIACEIHTGFAYHKTGAPTDRTIHPDQYWAEFVFQTAITAGFVWAAVHSW
jgi:hypothetical protein